MRRAEALFCPHPMERSKQRMLSTLVSLYKLLGTGNFFKVLPVSYTHLTLPTKA